MTETLPRTHHPHLLLTIDTSEPIELGAFVGAFTSIGVEFERFIKEAGHESRFTGCLLVKEVRSGSIIAELVPVLALAPLIIPYMNDIQILEDFVKRWGARIHALFNGDISNQPKTKSELETIFDGVKAIANDRDGRQSLQAVHYEDGERKVKLSIEFSSPEALSAQSEINARRKELDNKSAVSKERVLMVFTRSDINNAEVGKRSGERVKIEELSPKSLALMYSSSLAEERIKHEIREADENVYKRGFVVDVKVTLLNGAPVAYAVTSLHGVIDLQD
jgi:hypothetical protein